MRSRLKAGLVCLVVCTAVVVAGCGDSEDTEGGTSGAESTSSSSEEPKKVLFISLALGAPGQIQIRKGLEAQAKKYGDEVSSLDANASVGRANSLMATGVRQGYDAIVLDSFPPKALAAGLAATRAAKIPVYLAATFSPPPEGVALTMAMRGGVPQTERMIEDIGDKADVLAFTYPPGDSCADTEKGFDSVVAKHPDIKVTKHPVKIPGWEEDAAATTRAWLQSRPKGSGTYAIWGCWDGPNIGAVSALRQAGRDDVKVFGKDGTAEALKILQKKNGEYEATVWFDLRGQGVTIIDRIHSDAKLGFDNIKLERIDQDYVIVDESNVDSFLKEHPETIEG